VVKRQGSVDAFEPERFFSSIKFAIKKRPLDKAERTNEVLIRRLYALTLDRVRGRRTVTSAQLAQETMRVLLNSEDDKLMSLISPVITNSRICASRAARSDSRASKAFKPRRRS